MSIDYKYIFKKNSKEYDSYLNEEIEKANSNGRKTVLFVCDTYYPTVDGVVNVFDNCASRLMEKGFNVFAFVPDYKGKAYVRSYPVIAAKSVYSGLLNYQIPLPGFDGKVKKALKKLRIDLIHCHSPFFIGKAAKKIHAKRNVPMITTFHSQFRQDFEKAVHVKFIVSLLLNSIMKVFCASDEVWTMTPATEGVLRSYGYSGKTRLIPNGTNFPKPENYEEVRSEARKAFGITDQPLFLFVGRLVIVKNILFLADVLGILKKEGLNFKAVFAGDGPDRKKLEQQLKKNGVEENCILLGHVSGIEKLNALYSAADLFLFPSKYDMSSIVQIEAASRYLPGAFIKGTVTSYAITDGVNGFAFEGDAESFANGVFDAVTDRERLKRISQKAFEDLYVTWDDVTKKTLEAYRELLIQ